MMPSTTFWQPALPSDDVLPGYQYLFLINPAAGQPNTPDMAVRLAAAVCYAGSPHTCEIRMTDRAGHGADLAAEFALQHGAQGIVVACGGDGTAHEIAQSLLGTQTALAILPLGTGNDFARAFLSSLNLDQLLGRIAKPQIRPIDLLEVNGRMCLNITSFGFDTRVQSLMMAINRRLRWLGPMSYPLAIVIGLLGNRTFTFSCALDGAPRQKVHYILAALCNGRFYGGGFNPAPQASVEDGSIEWVQVDPLSLPRILGLIPKYKQGRHLGDPAVHGLSVKKGQLWAAPGQVLLGNIDGELFEATEISFKVVPGAIRFAFF
ncbi:MAG: diacylglycerol kinase family lipid kinase [Eubacteriales bacterium]|nr:diacylglycerol kinase family lipid kinase [Eubacteriales bacterium]